MRKTLTILGGIAVLTLTAPAATALAAPSAPQVGATWKDNGDSLYAADAVGEWVAASSGSTIGSATDCQAGGWCEHTTGGGNCLTWQSGSDTVTDATCAGLPRQFWFLNHETYSAGSGDVWQNEYASAVDGCSTGLISRGNGIDLQVVCPQGSGGGYGQKQLWN